MKKVLFLLAIIAVSIQLHAQSGNYYDQYASEPPAEDLPKFYLGVGTGINVYTGLLGISGNYRIDNKLFLQGGIGLSMWGYRSSIGLRYDRSLGKGFTYGLGLSNSTGIEEIELELETANGDVRMLNMEMENAPTLNLKAGYNWMVGRKNTFYINLGYAIPFKNQPWQVKDGTNLSVASQQVLEILAPGGIIFELGFTFGF